MSAPSSATSDDSDTPGGTAGRQVLPTLLTLLFVIWCFVVGTLLLYAPWMPVWVRWASGFPNPSVQEFLAHPTLRGAVCGFGLFHLVWGTHDLDALIARFLRRQIAKSEAAESIAGDNAEGEEGEGGTAAG